MSLLIQAGVMIYLITTITYYHFSYSYILSRLPKSYMNEESTKECHEMLNCTTDMFYLYFYVYAVFFWLTNTIAVPFFVAIGYDTLINFVLGLLAMIFFTYQSYVISLWYEATKKAELHLKK